MYQIFAVEPANDVPDKPDYLFGPSYCLAMRLPFKQGWDRWAVYQKKGANLVHIQDCQTYEEAEECVEDLTALTVH